MYNPKDLIKIILTVSNFEEWSQKDLTDDAPTVKSKELVDWDYYTYPDGQLQVYFLNYPLYREDLPDSLSIKIEASLPDPTCLHLFQQIVSRIEEDFDDVEIAINYLYGARCDKDKHKDVVVVNVAEMITTYLDNLTSPCTLLAPHCATQYFDLDFHLPLGLNLEQYDYIIFPDHSAKERFSKEIGEAWSVTGEKERDGDGKITKHVFPKLPPFSKVLVIDDLCDGGKTFLNVAEECAQRVPDGKLDLFIFHGVFSNNALKRLLDNGFDRIVVSNSLPQPQMQKDLLSPEEQERVWVFNVWSEVNKESK